MRAIFVVMLLSNVAFFVWQKFYVDPKPVVRQLEVANNNQVNRLLLLSEVDETALRQRATGEMGDQPQSAGEDTGGDNVSVICYSVGPLPTGSEVERIATWLGERGATTTLRESERREVSRFWVYFPPFSSRGAANEKVAQMKSENIDDIYVIPAGDMANAVSLGLYSQRESLERRLSELRDKGYDPKTVPRYETRVASWYDVELNASTDFPLSQFVAEFPGTEATPQACS